MLAQEVSDGCMSFWNGMFRLAIRLNDARYIFELDVGDRTLPDDAPRLRSKVADIMNQTMSIEAWHLVCRMTTTANEFVEWPESFAVLNFRKAMLEHMPLNKVIIWTSNHDLEDPEVLDGMITVFYPAPRGLTSINFTWTTCDEEERNVSCEFRQTITPESAAEYVFDVKAIIAGTSNLPLVIAWNAQRSLETAAMQSHWVRTQQRN